MLYIKCDTRDMNYAANVVCADGHKAPGTFSRVSVKTYDEFQVHHFLMEDKETSPKILRCFQAKVELDLDLVFLDLVRFWIWI